MLAVQGRDGGDVDHPRVARLRQLLPQQVGQEEVGEMVALKKKFRKAKIILSNLSGDLETVV